MAILTITGTNRGKLTVGNVVIAILLVSVICIPVIAESTFRFVPAGKDKAASQTPVNNVNGINLPAVESNRSATSTTELRIVSPSVQTSTQTGSITPSVSPSNTATSNLTTGDVAKAYNNPATSDPSAPLGQPEVLWQLMKPSIGSSPFSGNAVAGGTTMGTAVNSVIVSRDTTNVETGKSSIAIRSAQPDTLISVATPKPANVPTESSSTNDADDVQSVPTKVVQTTPAHASGSGDSKISVPPMQLDVLASLLTASPVSRDSAAEEVVMPTPLPSSVTIVKARPLVEAVPSEVQAPAPTQVAVVPQPKQSPKSAESTVSQASPQAMELLSRLYVAGGEFKATSESVTAEKPIVSPLRESFAALPSYEQPKVSPALPEQPQNGTLPNTIATQIAPEVEPNRTAIATIPREPLASSPSYKQPVVSPTPVGQPQVSPQPNTIAVQVPPAVEPQREALVTVKPAPEVTQSNDDSEMNHVASSRDSSEAPPAPRETSSVSIIATSKAPVPTSIQPPSPTVNEPVVSNNSQSSRSGYRFTAVSEDAYRGLSQFATVQVKSPVQSDSAVLPAPAVETFAFADSTQPGSSSQTDEPISNNSPQMLMPEPATTLTDAGSVTYMLGNGPCVPQGCPYLPGQSGAPNVCGVDCGRNGAPCCSTWGDSRCIPWSLFGPGEYVGPARKEHVSTYYLRVNDLVTLTYITSRRKEAERYRIGCGDRLRLEWLQSATNNDATLDRELMVQPDGTIPLPLIGDVTAAGKTVKDLREELIQHYGKFQRDPQITVTPLEVNIALQDILNAVTSVSGSNGQTQALKVTPEGTIQAPGLGSVFVQGLTLEELRTELEARYAATFGPGLLISPSLTEKATSYVFVGGEVKAPARYVLEGPTTVMQAVAMAGSWNNGGNLHQVIVFRRDENWCLKATKIDIRAPLYGHDPCPADDVWLRDNDLVIVPKTRILCATDVIDLYFTRGVYAVFPVTYFANLSRGSSIIAP